MTRPRGDGAGIEVGATGIRAVRLAADTPGRVVSAVDERVFRPDLQGTIDALVRVATRLSLTPDDEVTIASFAEGDRIIGWDATGWSVPDLAARSPRPGTDGANRWIVDAGPRRWQLDVRGDAGRAAGIRAAAAAAGLAHARFEPSPLALARLATSAPRLLWRVDRAGVTWCALCADGLPILAGPATAPRRIELGVVEAPVPEDEHRSFVALLDREPERAEQQLPDLLRRGASRHHATVGLSLLGDPYPAFPDSDVRSIARQCVALGAALSAAGLVGRVRTLRQLHATQGAPPRRPWLVERVNDDPAMVRSPRRLRRRGNDPPA